MDRLRDARVLGSTLTLTQAKGLLPSGWREGLQVDGLWQKARVTDAKGWMDR